ncbi:MAG: hypothetical protein ABFC57_18565 [Veillonellales bacterium]
MKIVNKPVKVLAIFKTDGKIEPVQFTLDDKVINVDKVVKSYEEHLAGNLRLVFLCEQREKYFYELKYEIESGIWYMFMQ